MNNSGFNRKLTTIFSADVAGYSRLMGEDEATTVKTLTAYRKILADLIRQHRGRVIDSPGDNLLAEFTSVVDAVQCAVSVQKEIQARNAELPEERKMRFRIGINLGDVIEEEDRIYGDGVNIAARLEGLADPGGICISKTAFDQIESKLPLGYEFMGEQEVKNIAKPVGAYRVLMEPRVKVAHRQIRRKKTILRPWRKAAMILVVLLLLLTGAAALIWDIYFQLPEVERLPEEKRALDLSEGPSIAVLPFVNMSGDPDQGYFSDGLTENIITGLSTVPQLFVIARNSTFFYKGKSIKVQQVAKELGVQYVLEGSVQKEGDRVRITAQLIDAKSGRHLWAGHYDRDLKEIFAIQDEITIKIIKALRLTLTDGMLVKEVDRYPCTLEAHMKMMKALAYGNRANKEGNILARQEAEEAMALAPEHPLPYVILAFTHINDLFYGSSMHPLISLAQATKLAKKALALDEAYSPGYHALSSVSLVRGEHEKAITLAEKGIELNPNNPSLYWVLGVTYTMSDRPGKGIEFLKKAIRLNPIPQSFYLKALGDAYAILRRYEEAIAMYKKALHRAPDDIMAHVSLASAYIASGQEKNARAEAQEVLRIDSEFSVERFAKRVPFKNQAETEQLIDALRKAGLK
jgi:adenylate cyclase